MKQLLELEKTDRKTLLVDAETIVAIEEGERNTCLLFCIDHPQPFTVSVSSQVLVRKLTEARLISLIKV
jgi:hypothetical protein